MVVFFHNRHVEPLQGLIRRIQADDCMDAGGRATPGAVAEPDLTSIETGALAELARNIEIETGNAPYRLWRRDQKTIAAKHGER